MAGGGIDINFGQLNQALQLGMQLGQGIARARYSRGLHDIETQQDAGQYQDPDALAARDAAIRDLAYRTGYDRVVSAAGYDPTQASAGSVAALNQQAVQNASYQAGATAAGTAANNYQDGDIPQAIRLQSAAQARAGNLAAGIQGLDYAQRRQVGEDSITGGTPDSGQPAGFDPSLYSRNMAAAAAQQGQGQEALGWQQQALQQAQQQGQTLLGRAAMIASNPSLGTPEQAAGLLTAAATRLGFGNQQIVWDPDNKHFFAAQDGKPVGQGFDANDLASFLSEDPATLPQRLAAVRAQQAQQQYQSAQDINKDVFHAQLDRAKNYDPTKFDDHSILAAQAALEKTAAGKAGWKLQGTIREDPATHTVSAWGTTPSGKPIVITQQPGSSALTITDRNGNEVDSSEFSGAAANQVQLSLRSALSKLSTDRARAAQGESLGELEAIRQQALRNIGLGQGGSGALPIGPGSVPAAKVTPQAVRRRGAALPTRGAPQASTQDAGGSPYAYLDGPQVQAESGGNTAAVSPAGARGAWQLLPATARVLERQAGLPAGATDRDPQLQASVAGAYRDALIQRYARITGDPHQGVALALAAYNAGEPAVDAYLSGQRNSLPAETVQYVNRILSQAGPNSQT